MKRLMYFGLGYLCGLTLGVVAAMILPFAIGWDCARQKKTPWALMARGVF